MFPPQEGCANPRPRGEHATASRASTPGFLAVALVRSLAMAIPTRVLVHRRVDGWLLGGVGIVAWLLLTPSIGGDHSAVLTGWVAGAFLVVTSTHFGSSYHLAYGNGWSDVRRHPVALGLVPALGVLVGVVVFATYLSGAQALAAQMVRNLLILVFTLTGWHYVKQAFGVGMLSARSYGMKPTGREIKLWRYGLYPIWIYDLLRVYGVDRGASYRQINIAVPLVPQGGESVLRWFAVACLIAVAASMIRVAHQARTLPPMGLWGAYLTGALWFLLPPAYLASAVVLPGIHAVQYLACVHRAEIDWAVERKEPQVRTLWLSLFGGAAAGGLLASTWLPSMIDGSFTTPALPGLFGSLLFVYLNLHHYAIDATIWRSSGEHVKRISKGPAVVDVPRPASTPVAQPALV